MQIETQFGPMQLAVNAEGAVTRLTFGIISDEANGGGAARDGIVRQLEEFLAGRRTHFDFPLAPAGTDFQKRVWAELVRIPYGQTISYRELAERVGSRGGARAVGRANATNPIALVVPCHRVIGADGSLTGYAYGVELKKRLLDFERGQGRI